MLVLCKVMIHMILLEKFLSLSYVIIKKLKNIKGSDFAGVDLLDYKLHRVRLNRDGSYIKSPKWKMKMMMNDYDGQ